jgi:competence protein ComEA
VSDAPASTPRPLGARARLARLLPAAAGAPRAAGAPAAARATVEEWEPEDPAAPDPAAQGVLARLGGAAAFDPGRPGLRVLAAVAAVVVLGAAAFAWWSRPRPEPVVAQLTATAPAAPSPTAPAELVVAVTGMVHEPGLVRLPPGSRVADAIEAAGGVLPETDLDYLNLARTLTDGELVAVGIPPPPGAADAGAGPGGAGGKVNLNTATQAELETLPGVGPALAQRIINYRTDNGGFGAVSDLRQVSGIGEVRYAELRDLVTV